MRKWIFVDWDVMQKNGVPIDQSKDDKWGRTPKPGGDITHANSDQRLAPIVVTIDDGNLATDPDGWPVRAAAMALGTRCFKVVIEGPGTHKNDNGRHVHFTDGRIKIDDGPWID